LSTPVTPVTPVSAEAFLSLQNVILDHNARALDRVSKQSLDRHVHKLTKAAQTSFARSALLQDQVKFLLRANNEAKLRRATASTVLGKAKEVSFEDLELERMKQAEKKAAEEGKKRTASARKRRKITSQAGMDTGLESLGDTPDAAGAAEHCGEARACAGEDDSEEPWRAPVARMW
jgi:hypothetical protein